SPRFGLVSGYSGPPYPWNDSPGTDRCFQQRREACSDSAQSRRFDPPHWVDCKIHPDHHVRLDGALYSVPSRWDIGMKVQVRADRSLVRIYVHGELIKTHERKSRGGRSTDYNDYPEGKAPYAMRWPNFYCKRARDLG